jgi:hypothetical protein
LDTIFGSVRGSVCDWGFWYGVDQDKGFLLQQIEYCINGKNDNPDQIALVVLVFVMGAEIEILGMVVAVAVVDVDVVVVSDGGGS